MAAQSGSGFLDSFLKFLRGEETETFKRGRATVYRPPKLKTNESRCEYKKVNSGRRGKTRKVRDKIEKEKHDTSESEDLSSSAETTEVVVPNNKDINCHNRCHDTDIKEKNIVEEDSNRVNDKVEVRETNSCSVDLDEKLSINKVENEKQEQGIKDCCRDQKVEKEQDDQMITSDQSKNNLDEASEKMKQGTVMLNISASNRTEEGDSVSNDSATTETNEDMERIGRKRKVGLEEEVPQRRLSSRRAKEKLLFSYVDSEAEDNPDFDIESDSDNDPVWVPNDKKVPSDDEGSNSWPGDVTANWKTKKARCISPVKFSSKENEDKKGSSLENIKNVDKLPSKTNVDSPSEKKAKIENHITVKKDVNTTKGDEKDIFQQHATQMPFPSGSFIALKSDLEELEEPTIWRVDGKALLQKYEPFRAENGSLQYRNVSTYSGWGPMNTALYQSVPVKFIHQNRFETIVEIIQEQLVINDDKLLEKLMKDSEKHAYAYEVYLQTLVSRALDPNFLNEIATEKDSLQNTASTTPHPLPRFSCNSDHLSKPPTDDPTEQSVRGNEGISANDEYFILSVDEMDKVCEEKKKKLLQIFGWSKNLKESLCTWPKLKTKLKDEKLPYLNCQICSQITNYKLIELEGQAYCNRTLEYITPSINSYKCKTLSVCQICAENIEVFNKIVHLKYHTFNECTELVSLMKSADPSKDSTAILHDILADTAYIAEKFQEVNLLWAQADLKCRKNKPEEIML